MAGPLLLLAAFMSPASDATPPARDRAAQVRPARVSARATATIRVVSGVRFGASYTAEVAGADRRSSRITNADGTIRQAELLEFQ